MLPTPMTAKSDQDGQLYWDRHAKSYDRAMLVLGRPVPRMIELAAQIVNGRERVLEVAAGTGLVTAALARSAREVVATDYAAGMVKVLEERVRAGNLDNVRCEKADVYSLRFEPASFDAVVAANVLHLVPDLTGALTALIRVLKPGGALVVPTYCHGETLRSRLASRVLSITAFPARRRFTSQSLRQAVEAAGVRVTSSQILPGLIPIGFVAGVN